ncbi:hypothetical protein BH11BAC4_BH11BAC4_02810 [soil metagenome]
MLACITIDEISPETYCRKYLGHLLSHEKYYLSIYADVLDKLLASSRKQLSDITLIDFGSGNGLLGLFAKYCGFKKVILVDLDEKFVHASKQLSAQLGIDADAYISGDIDTLMLYCKNELPDAIAGTDVIEHIYDLNYFFNQLRQINPSIVSVFTTASNPVNIFKVKTLKKVQRRDELEGGEPSDHALFGEIPLEPFLKTRESIIRKKYIKLSNSEIITLAKETRGLIEADIIKAVEEYQLSKKLPVPADGFNTCNPLNGSWTERILSLNAYISLYRHAGFTCKFYAGFYNDREVGQRSFVKKLLNAGVEIFGKRISPYIVIVGQKI